MVELIVRIVTAAIVMAAAGVWGTPDFDVAWRVAAVFASYSFLAFALEQRGFRNYGVAGLIAVADAAVIAFLLADAGRLETLGFLTLAPVMWAAARFQANPAAMAPLGAAWILIGSNLFGGAGFTPLLLGQALALLAIGLLAGQSRTVVEVREVRVEAPIMEREPEGDEVELRDNFRELRDHTRELERRGRRDRVTAALHQAVAHADEHPYQAVAAKLAELVGAEGVSLYTATQQGDRMIVRAVEGDVPEPVTTAAFEVPKDLGDGQIRHRFDRTILALRDPDRPLQVGTVLLRERGRLIGMATLFHRNVGLLDEAVRRAEEASETVAEVLRRLAERDEERRRLRELELLYLLSGTAAGAETATSLAARTVRELGSALRADHLAFLLIDGEDSTPLASFGTAQTPWDAMSFAGGPGLGGWLKTGAPELALFDARDDLRLPKEDALKRRTGSFLAVPVQTADGTTGVLTALTNRVGGLAESDLEALRVAAAELGHALDRLAGAATGHPSGLATPGEFHRTVAEHPGGHLVYLEVLRTEELAASLGRAAFELGLRRLAHRIRASLPSGGLLCRRDEGDYIAYLQTEDAEEARRWANSATATASMVGLKSPDGTTSVPLALRAKVAVIAPQNHQISQESAA